MGEDTADAGPGFDLWSMGEGTWDRDGGPPGTDNALYCWLDDLCQRNDNSWVGLAAFRGLRTGDPNKIDCTAWFQIDDNGGGWSGSLVARGDVTLVGGRVDHGSLRVISSTSPASFRIQISRENPKRYKTV